MATKTAEPDLRAKETFVVVLNARQVKYQRRIVRDRRTGRLAEVDITELPPEDPGDEGIPYVFKAGEVVAASHPAVQAKPAYFQPVELGPPR